MDSLRERVERTLDQVEAHIRDRSFSYASAAIANAKELLALLDGGERPEPVVTAVVDEDGFIADFDYEAFPAHLRAPEGDMVSIPLYASPVGRTPVSEGEATHAVITDGAVKYVRSIDEIRDGLVRMERLRAPESRETGER